jgi:membrane protease YdiL (CAAX protease family)
MPNGVAELLDRLGLAMPHSWSLTILLAVAWFGLMVAYSPLADRLASRWFRKPPTLETFRPLQQSRVKLIIGIIIAWLLGGITEEMIFRGLILKSTEIWLSAWLAKPIALTLAIFIAAIASSCFHFYQGPRAMVIILQLSILFGVLFVVSGYNLWTVIACHGLYDTVAFIRYANKQSKYSNPEKTSNIKPL